MTLNERASVYMGSLSRDTNWRDTGAYFVMRTPSV